MSPSPATPADVDLSNSDYRQIFCAALQGLCANPNVFGTYRPGDEVPEAVRLALACTFFAIVGVEPPDNGAPAPEVPF